MKGTFAAYAMVALSGALGAGPGNGFPDAPRADQEQRPGMEGAGGGTAIEREVFTYRVEGRRDPFLPPLPSADDVPRYRGIRLLGIISHSDPRLSVAVIRVDGEGAGGGAGSDDAGPRPDAGENHRVRIGDRIGGIEVLAIDARHVVVEAEGPGGPARQLLELADDSAIGSR